LPAKNPLTPIAHWPRRLRQRWNELDILATHGVEPRYRKGMRNFWLDSFFASISSAFMLAYVSLYALALGATNAQIGALSSTASLLATLAPIPGAQLTERWGSRRQTVVSVWVIVRSISVLLVFVPFFLSGQAAIYAVITIWALRSGLGNLAHPAWVSLTGDIIPTESRGRYFSRRAMAMAAASMVFVPLAGQIIQWGGSPGGYQWAFGVSAFFGFLALHFYSQIPEPATQATPGAQRRGSWLSMAKALITNRTFLLFVLIEMVWNLGIQVGGPYFTVYQVKILDTTPAMIGLIETAGAIAAILGQWFWGRVIDRRGSRWVLTVCAFTIPALPFIWFVMTKAWHAFFMRVPSGFLWAGFELADFNLLLELPGQDKRTQATAFFTTMVGISSIVGPLIGSVIIDRLGYLWDFGISGVTRLVAAILFLLLLRPFRRVRQGLEPLRG
jgi:MFS family permease